MLISLAACDDNNTVNPDSDTDGLDYSISAEWEAMHASFARDDSSQYNNATLMMKYLSNGCVMFEFRLMEGSEAEDEATDITLYGVFVIDETGEGLYESVDDSENALAIKFLLSEDGKTVNVSHDGDLLISPDGQYIFTDASVEVSEFSAIAILEHLPTAATSLNHNTAEYTIEYPDALVSDWFYPVEAVYADGATVIAKFLIAKDLSAVFRVDDDIDPVMIFGSAQPMMDAYVMEEVTNEAEDGSAETDYEPMPLVRVLLEDAVSMGIGETCALSVKLPWENLPYSIRAESLNTDIAHVDETIVTGIAQGEVKIKCTVECEDGSIEIILVIQIAEEVDFDTVDS